MEGLYRKYGDRVNFLYMYVREAHPNPANAPCGPTADLGWNHPSHDTVSMEDRAQRARWLKHDFDLSFPYVIDEMNGVNQSTWWPYGFYVGWFVDCDRQVHIFEPWAWATPETQWCGLPLADVDALEAFLDDYLANPPSCYRGIDRSATAVIPAVARLTGFGDTDWSSDVTIANPHAEPVTTTLTYLPRDCDNTNAAEHVITVEGGRSVTLNDVVGDTFDTTGSGALIAVSDRQQVIVSRTSNLTPGGTFGQLIPAFDHRMAIREGQTGHLVGLEETAAFRSNLGLVNLDADEVAVEVRLISASGDELGVLAYDLPPRGAIQVNRILRELSIAEVAGFRAEVRVVTPGGRVLPYASVVDNASGDPTFVDLRLNTYAIDVIVPAAARVEGANGTLWRSDVMIYNARPDPVQATVSRWVRDTDNRGAETASLTVAAGQSIAVPDVLDTLFDAGGAAALAIHGSAGLMVTSRTFNDAATGTFGQLIPGVDPTDVTTLRPGRPGHFAGLAQSAATTGRRTNLGLVNLRDEPVRLEVAFFAEDGSPLGELEPELAPFEYVQIDRALTGIGVEEATGVRAVVEVTTEGGQVLAYASTIDNGTGDPVFQSASTLQ